MKNGDVRDDGQEGLEAPSPKGFAPRVVKAQRLLSQLAEPVADAESAEELNALLEELNVAEEELRQQNEELYAARDLLEQERQHYRDLFELAPDGYLVTDTLGVVREANRAAAALLAVAPDRLVGKPLASFVALPDRRAFRRELLPLGEPRRTLGWDVRLQPRGGQPFYAALTVAFVLDRTGKPTALRWQVRDAGERRRADEMRARNAELEQRVLERTAQLQAAYERQEEYLRIIAHDLRQPLTVLQGHSQMLLERLTRGSGDGRDKHSAEVIYHSSRHLAAMIGNLVETVRLESGQLQLQMEPADLCEVLPRLLERICTEDEVHRVRLAACAPPLLVLADVMYLERALANLVGNALRFSPKGAPVVLRLDKVNGEAVVAVADQGSGIDPEEQAHLFERFYRSKTGRTTTEGLGLGLYITRPIVQAHGGRIWVESEPGTGTTFFFSLPLTGEK